MGWPRLRRVRQVFWLSFAYELTQAQPQWYSLAGGFQTEGDSVSAVAEFQGVLIAGGGLNLRGSVAEYDGPRWTVAGAAAPTNPTFALAVCDSLLFAGYAGTDHAFALGFSYWGGPNGTAWTTPSTPSPVHDGTVMSLICGPPGSVIVGGTFEFETASYQSIRNIALWNGTAFLPLAGGLSGPATAQSQVAAMAVWNGQLVAGGAIQYTGADPSASLNHLAAWNGSGWEAVGGGVGGASDYAQALAVFRGSLVVGGFFRVAGGAGGLPVGFIASYNGSAWSPMAGGLSSIVMALTVSRDGATLFATGIFRGLMSGGALQLNGVAAWDGAVWSPLGEGLGNMESLSNGGVALAVLSSGSLLVGGTFPFAGHVASANVAVYGTVPPASPTMVPSPVPSPAPSRAPTGGSGLPPAVTAVASTLGGAAALFAAGFGLWMMRRRLQRRRTATAAATTGDTSNGSSTDWPTIRDLLLPKTPTESGGEASEGEPLGWEVPYTAISFDVDVSNPSRRKVLGSGGYGTTYAATYKGQTVAVKQMFVMQEALSPESLREARIQMALHHPHVLPCLGVCIDAYQVTRPCIYLLTPLKHMDLSRRLYDTSTPASLPPLPLSDRLRIAWQVALALQYLHGLPEPIVHADVKPANVLLDAEGNACLADFGISKARARDSSLTRTMGGLGTPPYRAPELALSTGGMRPACDMYSFGILAWELAAGRRPPCNDDPNHRPPLEALPLASSGLPDGFGGFLQQLWCTNREERLTADDAVRYFRSHLPVASLRELTDVDSVDIP